MLSEFGKVISKQMESHLKNGAEGVYVPEGVSDAQEISEISKKEIEEGVKILQPDMDLIKTQSLEAVKQSNLERTQASVKENNEFRELTEEEKQYLREKLDWSDKQLKKCTINENGVIYYRTNRCDLEGSISENGIPYERKIIEINGVKIEGVFPNFDSVFDTYLEPENYKSKTYADECNAKLKDEIHKNPELSNNFTPEQIKDIEENRTPTGYVWHHNEEPGKMQLVKKEDHDITIGGASHTGGNSLWGYDSIDKSKKGDIF